VLVLVAAMNQAEYVFSVFSDVWSEVIYMGTVAIRMVVAERQTNAVETYESVLRNTLRTPSRHLAWSILVWK
jgi:hypothetical protein